MTISRVHHKLDHELTFVDLPSAQNGTQSSTQIVTTTVELVFVRHAAQLSECRLVFQMPFEQLAQLLDRNPFGVAQIDLAMGDPQAHFGPGQPVTLETYLDPTLLPHLLALGERDETRAAALVQLQPDAPHPLLWTTSWHAFLVYQRHNGIRHGYSLGLRASAPQLGQEIGEDEGSQGNEDESTLGRLALATLVALQDLTQLAIAESQAQQTETPPVSAQNLQGADDVQSPTAALILAVLAADDWPVEVTDDASTFVTIYESDNGRWQCTGRLHDDPSHFVFYSTAAITVPAARRQAVAEFVTRANRGLILGNFELNFADGVVRFKTSVAVDEGTLIEAMIRPVLYGNVDTMDRYLPGLMAVSFGQAEPARVIAQIEQ